MVEARTLWSAKLTVEFRGIRAAMPWAHARRKSGTIGIIMIEFNFTLLSLRLKDCENKN